PEASRAAVEREAPGLAETMRAVGRLSSPMAIISRGVTGVVGEALVLNLPGSPRGAVESLETVLAVVPHALDLLAGHTQHTPSQTALPNREPAAAAGDEGHAHDHGAHAHGHDHGGGDRAAVPEHHREED